MTHAWTPVSPCDESCVRDDPVRFLGRTVRVLRGCFRVFLIFVVLPVMPLTAIPRPGHDRAVRLYSRLLLRCVGVRITMPDKALHDLRGVMVVGPHISWADVLVIWSVMPATFVAKADMVKWPGIGHMARALGAIPIDRTKLRPLPGVVAEVAARLKSGRTVATFPEGTSWCGLGYGLFRPAMFQAAIDADRPVLPLRLSYHHRDGRLSTVPAFVGEDTLTRSVWRVVATRQTVVQIHVGPLQMPGTDRRELARQCQEIICGGVELPSEHALAA